nr:hypothetical protein [Tanacetum cinerariifolium]
MRGSCTSLTELEYHLEEVYKATTDQLDWVNPEGQQYPHNLLQTLPLIPNNRGRRVIPFEHFINNDLEYLRGGIVQTSQHPKWFSQPRKPPTLDRDWNKTMPAIQGSAQSWISELANQADARFSFNELLDTLLDFSNFIMNRLGVDTLTPELLAGPTYELMRRSCNSLTELEYHLEEVYKATTDQLDWVNPEGQQKGPSLDQTGGLKDKKKEPRRPPSPDHDWNKTLPVAQEDAQSWINDLARQTDARSSFNELLDTPIDFSNFIMNRLNVDTLTSELLAGPTYELMRGSCTSLTELEYHLVEVYKATTDQLDWVNPEGQQYPHNLLQPLPLIPDNLGCRVIPFDHFINNDLEYLQRGASSRKYTTSVTKTKAVNYGHIKWIEDLVPRAMWIQQPIDYNRHALWGVSHWGRKRQQFYGY